MGLVFENTASQTALDEDEKEGLLVKSITTRYELDEFEQQNIEHAIKWSMHKLFKVNKILTEKFVCRLHKKMFDQTWKWAGEFRKTNKNIGVDKYRIGIELNQLLSDCRYWVANNTYNADEIAIRLKHRIVKIHPFPNGNGRHSRLLADILVEHGFGKPPFSWGSHHMACSKTVRKEYLDALFQADRENYEPLIKFARK
ncbi:MAG: mobile mystery protein B [Bacteroidales bacterium]